MSDIFQNKDEAYEEGKQPLHYFYNREERVKNAPQIVKDYYDGKMQPVRGFRVLFQKQNRYILLALVIFVAFAWIYTGLNSIRNTTKIDNTIFEIQAFCYDGQIFTNIKVKEAKSKNESEENIKKIKNSPKKIEAEIYFINIDNQIVEMKEDSIIYSGEEQYLRTKFNDYDIIRVDANIKVADLVKEISTPVKR